MHAQSHDVDVAILGGGLAGALTALRINALSPTPKLLLMEASDRLGSHRTWSFHASDLAAKSLEWLKPMVRRSWSETTVQFPRLKRTLPGDYHSIRSDDLHQEAMRQLGDSVLLNTRIERATDAEIEFKDGSIVRARCVLDARGISESSIGSTASSKSDSQSTSVFHPPFSGYQKFLGLDFLLELPHELKHPVLMDATCPQLDGFRFFYLLPWDEKRLLVEETYYSNSADLNVERLRRSIHSYVERRGWKVVTVEREEQGVLPIPMTATYLKPSPNDQPMAIGMRGGYFHATTGYSLPDAVRVAEQVATHFKANPDATTSTTRQFLTRQRRSWLSRQHFYRLLNRMLFRASEPSMRYAILQHFYNLPQDLIERFYAGQTTWTDRLRILSGRPPVPIRMALKSFSERSLRFGRFE